MSEDHTNEDFATQLKLKKAADAITWFLSTASDPHVVATWYDSTGTKIGQAELKNAKAVEKEDGWHLVGDDYLENGKEHCIGGAVLTATYELYRP
jgi:hypothetical protein